jgi:2-dehydro-3-deoxy-D-arabinonate dehydratase
MKLLQFWLPGLGKRVGHLQDGVVTDITSPKHNLATVDDFITTAATKKTTVERLVRRALEVIEPVTYEYDISFDYDRLDVAPAEDKPHIMMPVDPPEVWACGVTYMKSAEFREGEVSESKGIYDRVYTAERPEIFFKATAARCVGPNGAIGIRSDSKSTVPEPELALVLGENGDIVGYSLADDVSAWDIERENPLYLPQSKIYQGCCALGPVFVTADEIESPDVLTLEARIIRRGKVVFEESAKVSNMKRSFDELVRAVTLHNPLPIGSVLLTGTGIICPAETPLQDGDVVEIASDRIGMLSNTAMVLQAG